MSENDTTSDEITYRQIEENITEDMGGQQGVSILESFAENRVEILAFTLAVLFFGYHVWYGLERPFTRAQHAIVHLGFALVCWGGYRAASLERSDPMRWLKSLGYGAYILLAGSSSYYLYSNYFTILDRAGRYGDTEIYVSVVVIFLTMIALLFVSRLIFGIVVVGIVYALAGPYMPGIFEHQGLTLTRTITMFTIEFDGLYGVINVVMSTWVVPFILLAGLVEAMGAMAKMLLSATKWIAKRAYLQVGQVAVAASMVFGSINGSYVANVASTGAITIPLMKQNDYPPRLAAAIEAVASVGGQTLPPVMGAAAFLMAELIAPSYSEIVIAAAIPAVLFYFAVAFSIWVYSDEVGFRQRTITDIPTRETGRSLLLKYTQKYDFFIAGAVLLYYLIWVRADPMLSGIYCLVVLVLFRFVRRAQNAIQTGDRKGEMLSFVREIGWGCRNGVKTMVNISILVIPLGIVIRSLVVTGFAQRFSGILISAAGGNEILLVVMGAIGALMFGLGMPTVVAYLLVAIFIAPTIVQALPAGELQVHMFAFYFALVSAITPPVALAVLVAQGISGSKFLETSIVALKVGYPLYVLPILFLYQPILAIEPIGFATAALLLVGFMGLSLAMIAKKRFGYPTRFAIGALAAPLLFVPDIWIKFALAAALTGTFAYIYREQVSTAISERAAS